MLQRNHGNKVMARHLTEHGRRQACKTPGRSGTGPTALQTAVMVVVLIAALANPMSVFGQSKVERTFSEIDQNGDGQVSRTELRMNKFYFFYLRDTDQDKHLSFGETQLSKAAFSAADGDGDGKISGLEFFDARFTQFDVYDTNHDGVLTFEEFENFARLNMR